MDWVAPPPWNTHRNRFFKIHKLTKILFFYLYIDVAMVLLALVELLIITLIIVEKCKRH